MASQIMRSTTHSFTVDQILNVRDKFTELPYPGFSLDDVIRRHRQQGGHKLLTRGDNAWSATNAVSEEEGVKRLCQAELNKVAPEKYDEILGRLTNEQFFATERTMQVVVQCIFKKALEEPGYSELYARLCHDLTRFEMSLNGSSPTTAPAAPTPAAPTGPLSMAQKLAQAAKAKALPPPSPSAKAAPASVFRKAILTMSNAEFSNTHSAMAKLSDFADGEERDFEEGRITRRKKANIKFVGHLYMNRLLGDNIIVAILNALARIGKPDLPPSLDVEVMAELLETVGTTLDQQRRADVDIIFERVKELIAEAVSNAAYPPRIRFKMMDLTEMREHNWEVRVHRADHQTPTTLSEVNIGAAKKTEKAEGKGKLLLQPARGTVTPTGRAPRGGAQGGRFPSVPVSSTTAPESPSGAPGAGWRTVMAPGRDSAASLRNSPVSTEKRGGAAPAKAGKRPQVSFEARVKEIKTLWIAENSDECLQDWALPFADDGFQTTADLAQKVVFIIVNDACMVTTKNAQQEACMFLIRGLELDDEDLYAGLANVLATAITEGIQEDVPKFNERFQRVLTMMAGRTDEELYTHGSRILFKAHDLLEPVEPSDDTNIVALVSLWKGLRLPETPLGTETICAISTQRLEGPEQDELAAHLIKNLFQREATTVDSIAKWMIADPADANVVDKLKEMKIL